MSLRLAGLAALWVLILSVAPAYAQINLDGYIEWLIRQECKRQGVEAAFPLAVARTESSKGKRKFRTGLCGSPDAYYMPFGIHPDYLRLRGWRVDRLDENIRRGVARCAGGPKILPSYNPRMTKQYKKAVMACMKKYGR